MKYAVVVNTSYPVDHNDPSSRHYDPRNVGSEKVKKFIPFETKESLVKWILNDGDRSSYKIIQFQEMTLEVNLKEVES